uniref:Putative secreted peptide n=1 Tax=Anopheles braziliensis TaxID=58242 RepID=A0A2M3ZPH7_9DIPT
MPQLQCLCCCWSHSAVNALPHFHLQLRFALEMIPTLPPVSRKPSTTCAPGWLAVRFRKVSAFRQWNR